jgi:hypothetical protein
MARRMTGLTFASHADRQMDYMQRNRLEGKCMRCGQPHDHKNPRTGERCRHCRRCRLKISEAKKRAALRAADPPTGETK